MSWEQMIAAVKEVGFPAVAFFLLMYFGNKWATMLVSELRLFRETMLSTTTALHAHVSYEARKIMEMIERENRR